MSEDFESIMSAHNELDHDVAAAAEAAAAAVISSLPPVRKRKLPDDEAYPEDGKHDLDASLTEHHDLEGDVGDEGKPGAPVSRAREIRLEQNRKAARESRRRKKVMIEELQRSVIFFSRANSALKQQNDELTRLLMQAQATVTATDEGKVPQENQNAGDSQANHVKVEEQAQAQAVATQAMFESQGFPAAAARAAAQTMNQGAQGLSATNQNPGNSALPAMQPGATMQAMANFQQAAAAAMQAAMKGKLLETLASVLCSKGR
jgi:hypothetical protein